MTGLLILLAVAEIIVCAIAWLEIPGSGGLWIAFMAYSAGVIIFSIIERRR